MIKPLALSAAALVLAACVQQNATVLDESRSFRVTDVQVEAATAAAAEQRGFNLPEAEAEALLRAPILDGLDDLNAGGAVPVTVAVNVTRIFVPNVASAAVGRSGPVAEGTAQLFNATTGDPVSEPFAVNGLGQFRAGGSLGVVLTAGSLATGGERGELTLAGQGLARSLAQTIYGTDPAE